MRLTTLQQAIPFDRSPTRSTALPSRRSWPSALPHSPTFAFYFSSTRTTSCTTSIQPTTLASTLARSPLRNQPLVSRRDTLRPRRFDPATCRTSAAEARLGSPHYQHHQHTTSLPRPQPSVERQLQRRTSSPPLLSALDHIAARSRCCWQLSRS